jgi:hypothetical protein
MTVVTVYQLVPYLVSVAVRGKPDETRALDNLFAGGEQLAEELACLLSAHVGHLLEEPDTGDRRPRRLQVLSVGRLGRQLNAVIAPGRMGLESTLRSTGGQEHRRKFTDTELVPLRHHLIYPASGHRAILLAERVGGNGAISALSLMLKKTWSARHHETTLHIEPAMAEDAFTDSLENRPIKSLVFRRAKGPNGNLAIGKHDVEYDLKVRPRGRGRRWSLKELMLGKDEDALPAGSILSEIAPVLKPGVDPKTAGAALLEEGWGVAVELDLPGNVSRTVYVDQSTASTMSFPVIDGELEPKDRPKDAAIALAAKRIIGDDLLSDWGIGEAMAAGVTWTPKKWTKTDGWKVMWDVVADQPVADSP